MGSAQPQPTRAYDFTGGSNAVADQVDTDLNTLYTVLQGGVGNTHIGDDAAILLSKLSTAAWASWTPSWTNLTVGNGTLTAKYIQIGSGIWFDLVLVFGSTTSIAGAVSFSLPVTAVSPGGTITSKDIGTSTFADAATAQYGGFLKFGSTTIATPTRLVVSGSNLTVDSSITSTTPFTWTTSDELVCHGFYQAA